MRTQEEWETAIRAEIAALRTDVFRLVGERDTLRALLRQAEVAWTELSYMLSEHERIALLVQQPPWFIAPMSRPIREMDAIITAIRALLRETATP